MINRVTAPEGFVAIRSGRALKLVDRLEFSRANFTADKNWDKGSPMPSTENMKSFTSFIVEAVSSQTVAKPDPDRDEADMTVAFGRFNPPTTGHERLLNKVKQVAGKGNYEIYPSRSNDPDKNPLDPDTKIGYMQQMFPNHAKHIMNNPKTKTIFDALKGANERGAKSVNIVVGQDRQKEFENLANKYNNKLYQFDRIKVISAGDRDPDGEGVSAMSASKLRKAAADDDFKTFRSGIPRALKDDAARKLYDTLRQGMKPKKKQQNEMWRIAPKFDWKNLRENYMNGNIFRVGDVVENDNTGLIGKIIRTGANHIIAVTEDNMMFKSWIKDITEKFTEVSGVPANQREVGTDALRQYTQRLSHNPIILNFIINLGKNVREGNA